MLNKVPQLLTGVYWALEVVFKRPEISGIQLCCYWLDFTLLLICKKGSELEKSCYYFEKLQIFSEDA